MLDWFPDCSVTVAPHVTVWHEALQPHCNQEINLLNYPTYSCLCTRADADLDAHIYLSQAHLTHIHICKHLETIEEVEVLDVGTCQHFSKHTNDRVWTVGKYVSNNNAYGVRGTSFVSNTNLWTIGASTR